MDYSRKKALLSELWAMEKEAVTVSGPFDILPLLQRYRNRKQEEFFVVTLDGNHRVIRTRSITKGLVNQTVAHPREVFRVAITDNATAIVVAHNHPSGSVNPSIEDENITKRLVKAGEIVGIPVLDHIIFSKSGYHSFKDAGAI